MQHIKFSKNWNNKLGLEVFSTIRKIDEGKKKWYLSGLKQVWQVIQSDVVVGYALLEEICFFQHEQLPRTLEILDTGILCDDKRSSLWKNLGIAPKDEVAFLLYRWVNYKDGEGVGGRI